jgi:hypothetical protein
VIIPFVAGFLRLWLMERPCGGIDIVRPTVKISNVVGPSRGAAAVKLSCFHWHHGSSELDFLSYLPSRFHLRI